jgi:hypothetical protein
MLNPLQAASSFACDGCGHHASFHNLTNAGEEQLAPLLAGGRKRAMILDAAHGRHIDDRYDDDYVNDDDDEIEILEIGAGKGAVQHNSSKSGGGNSNTGRPVKKSRV